MILITYEYVSKESDRYRLKVVNKQFDLTLV